MLFGAVSSERFLLTFEDGVHASLITSIAGYFDIPLLSLIDYVQINEKNINLCLDVVSFAVDADVIGLSLIFILDAVII